IRAVIFMIQFIELIDQSAVLRGIAKSAVEIGFRMNRWVSHHISSWTYRPRKTVVEPWLWIRPHERDVFALAGAAGFAACELRPPAHRAPPRLGVDQRRGFEPFAGTIRPRLLPAQGRASPGTLCPVQTEGAAPWLCPQGWFARRGARDTDDLRSARRISAQCRDGASIGSRRALRTVRSAQGPTRNRRLVRAGT